MIFTERTIKMSNDVCEIDNPIVLYRGDYNVEIRFTIIECPYKYSAKNSTNIIEEVDASYGQLVIRVPNDGSPIFSDVVETKRGSIVFTLSGEMIDESIEVGDYTFQIRLFDANKESRATIPPVENGISIREPIAFEDVTTTNEVGEATVGYALTTAATPEDAFDSQGNYNKTTWGTGDRITAAKLNKIEAGIDGVNKKVASGGASGGVADSVDWSNVQNKPTIPTKTSQLTNDSGYITSIPDEYITETELNAKGYATTSQIPTVPTNISEFTNDANYASETYVTNKIAEAQLGGNPQLSEFENKIANFLGDSQTEANHHKSKIYHEWVKDILGLSTVNNYGISGSTIAKISSTDGKSMCVRYANMSNDADLICVMGGINDRWFNIELGQFGDTNPLTFYGAMETLCDGLLTKYPGKTIIFITPTEENNTNYTNQNTTGYTATDFANAMKKVCAKYSIPVFDANTCSGIYPLNSAQAEIYTTDKLHLNDEGHKVLGKKLAKFILNGSLTTTIIEDGGESGGGGTTTSYSITNDLTNATSSNSSISVNEGSEYTTTLVANSGYTLSTVTVTMAGQDITSTVYSNGTITISNVIGNIVIRCIATQSQSGDGGSDYIGKTFTMTGKKNYFYHFTAIIANNGFKPGDVFSMSLTGSNATNLEQNSYNNGASIFTSNDTAVSNASFVEQVSLDGKCELTLNEDNTFTVTIGDRPLTSDPNASYLKVPTMIFVGNLPASFTIDSLSVEVNGLKQEILNIGGFFTEETFTLS